MTYTLYSQSCFEQRLAFVTEVREVCLLPYWELPKCKTYLVQRKTGKRKICLLTCIWPPKLVLPWETAFKDGQPKTKPTSWRPSSPSQPEGTLTLHNDTTLYPSWKQPKLGPWKSEHGKDSYSWGICLLWGPGTVAITATGKGIYMFSKLLEHLLVHSILTSRGAD